MKLQSDMFKAYDKKRDRDISVSSICQLQSAVSMVDIDLKRMALPFNDVESLNHLKRYRLNSKNYATMFLTKAKVMVDIINNLLTNFDDRLRRILEFFRKFRKSLKKNLEGVALTESVYTSVNKLKAYVSDLDTEVNARLEEMREMKDLLASSDDKGQLTSGYYVVAATNIQTYLNSLSMLIHRIEKDKMTSHVLAFNFSNTDNNTAMLERLTLISIECLRRFALEVVAVKLFDIHDRIIERINIGCQLAEEVAKANPKSFEGFEPSKLKFRLSSLIHPPLKRYIKTKIGLPSEIIIRDDDLKEFFAEKFVFHYPSLTPMFICSADVMLENARTKELTAYTLFLDVLYNDIDYRRADGDSQRRQDIL